MDKEAYKILKEINSLYLKTQSLQVDITQEQSREFKVQGLKEQRELDLSDAQNNLKELNKHLVQTENELSLFQGKLDQNKANISNVFGENEILSLQKQIDTYEKQVNDLEIKGLELLDKIESIETKIQEAKSFISGVQDTLKEIRLEIEENIKAPQKEIDILNQRIQLLYKSVPPSVKNLYKTLLEKGLKYGPLCQIEGDSCSVCRMSLPKLEIDQIEKNLTLKQCTGCSRIFIPISSLY